MTEIKNLVSTFLTRNSLPILCYHSITKSAMQMPAFTFMTADLFEEHMAFISNNYKPISLEEMFIKIQNREKLINNVCITFDDGYLNNYTTAFPILKKFNIPATIFLNTHFIGSDNLKWSDILYSIFALTKEATIKFKNDSYSFKTMENKIEIFKILSEKIKRSDFKDINLLINDLMCQMKLSYKQIKKTPFFSELKCLGWSEINEMKNSKLIDFGAHTHTHPILNQLTKDKAEKEIVVSINKLRQELDKIDYFAYPNGSMADYSSDHIKVLATNNIKTAFSTGNSYYNRTFNNFEVPRFVIGSDCSLAEINRIVLGKAIFNDGCILRTIISWLIKSFK